MTAREALSHALVLTIEGQPVIQCVSVSHGRKEDDWVIVTRDSDGEYQTIRELPKEAVDG
jgi:hypothetical protein